MSEKAEYYDDWQRRQLLCTCGWSGVPEQSTADYDSEYLTEYDCPQCQRSLLLVSYPTADQVKEAAAGGHAAAIKQLAVVEWRKRYAEAVAASRLQDAAGLAEVSGDSIDVVFELLERTDDVTEIVMSANGHVLHRELVYYESLEPLERLVPLLRQRYGNRLRSIDTTGANLYFLGDRSKSIEEMDAILGPLQQRTPPTVQPT